MMLIPLDKVSQSRLNTCHVDLILLVETVHKYFPCRVIEGYRDKETQNKAYAEGKSKLKFPMGNHNKQPSMAVDVIPFNWAKGPINWKDTHRFYYFGGLVMGVAKMLKDEGRMHFNVRYGGDWNRNLEVADETFKDLVHIELEP